MLDNRAWLSNKKWAKNRITSNAKLGHYLLWGFALIWNALTLPVMLDYEVIIRKIPNEPITAAVFLFPLVGIYVIVLALKATLQWKQFGPTPLRLDPFPGSLGGHVGGEVDTNIPFSMANQCLVSLSSVHSYTSGSGKNRKQREKILWQSEGVCHCEATAKGSRFIFRFSVPADLPPSDVKSSANYNLWRVNLSLELEGADFNRQFEVPVFDTGGVKSKGIRHGTEEHRATREQASAGLESIAQITPISGGVEAWFPAFQRPAQGVMLSIFGLIFASIGIGVGFSDAPFIFTIVFTLVGLLILLIGLHYLGKALLISVTTQEVKARRFLFGLAITTKRITASEFSGFVIKQVASMQGGKQAIVFYNLLAKSSAGKSFPVAERLTSRKEAELMKECFEMYLS